MTTDEFEDAFHKNLRKIHPLLAFFSNMAWARKKAGGLWEQWFLEDPFQAISYYEWFPVKEWSLSISAEPHLGVLFTKKEEW